jgi:hypothetical protein
MVSTFEFADHIVGVLIESNLNEELVHKMHAIILERLKENKKINLFIEIRTGSTISLAAFLKDQIFTLKHAGQFQKIAFVSDLIWIQNMMAVKDLVMDAEIRSFSNKNRMEAITWIAQ